MSEDGFSAESIDGNRIYIYRWLPSQMKPLKCIVQIAHGMAEHAGRYRDFAKFLNSRGIGVYANDHRGHGKTAGKLENVGYFADEDGWEKVVQDMFQLTNRVNQTHPGVPVFLLGHSMGSFLVRDYIVRPPSNVRGAVLSGTAGDPGVMGTIGILIAKWSCRFRGRKKPDKLLDQLSFGSFNKQFKPVRTKFDWLSRDETVVDRYVSDEYCGGIFTSGFFLDLFRGIKKINRPDHISRTPPKLPVLCISGEKDPVGHNTKGVKRVIRSFRKGGSQDVEFLFFPGGRHEMLNETNREEVYGAVSGWFLEKLNQQ